MYELSVQLEFSAAHHLRGYEGKCSRLHGHNYRVEVTVAGRELGPDGMLVDFGRLKELCQQAVAELDHALLNDHPFFQEHNPTSENLARYLHSQLAGRLSGTAAHLTAVRVWESASSAASYTEGGKCGR